MPCFGFRFSFANVVFGRFGGDVVGKGERGHHESHRAMVPGTEFIHKQYRSVAFVSFG